MPATTAQTSATTATYDVLITGARVIDGGGNPWFWGDVALTGDRIAAIEPPGIIPPHTAHEVVDARDHVVCPGFIDIQSHSIVPIFLDRRSLSKITQGVTTEIMGEGWTPAPAGGLTADPIPADFRAWLGDAFDEWQERARGWTRFGDWLADLEGRGVSVNVGSFLGAGTVRAYAKGFALGPATPSELTTMQRVIAAAMADGAFGLASALVYPPDAYIDTAELTALCETVAAHRGVHITHMRSEEARLLEALEETIGIAARTGVQTEIYHLKAAGIANWPLMAPAIARISAARAAGLDVTADMYPYVASGTGLTLCLPPWSEADGRLWDNLRDPATRARIRHEMLESSPEWDSFGVNANPENVILAGLLKPENRHLIGGSLAAAATARGEDWVDAALNLLLSEEQNIFCFYFEMDEANVRLQLQQPWITFSTDAPGVDPATLEGHGLHHPRGFGTYPRILGHYVRDEGVLPLEDAIRKMTSGVANRLSLRDRGLLRPGLAADIVVFDPATVIDHATFAAPHHLSTGIRDVWVNGARVLHTGGHTGALPGRRVTGPGFRPPG